MRLEAFFPPEGAAIVRVENRLRLIVPPYSLHDSALLREDSLADAILKHGFSASCLDFATWEELIDFLNQELIAAREKLGQAIPESIDAREVIEIAPATVLDSFLDQVEHNLLPASSFEQAEDFLMALLSSDVVLKEPLIAQRGARLLQQTKQRKEHAEEMVAGLAAEDVRFVSLERHNKLEESSKVARIIKERRCMFATC